MLTPTETSEKNSNFWRKLQKIQLLEKIEKKIEFLLRIAEILKFWPVFCCFWSNLKKWIRVEIKIKPKLCFNWHHVEAVRQIFE